MAITVKHNKVSTIPDTTDTSLVRPSDWNADHTLVGTIDVANGGTGASTLTGYVKGNGTSAMTAVATVPSTDITGLGTMSTQNTNAVAITGGTINGTTIGATTASTGRFSDLTDTGLTSGRVVYASTGGNLVDASNFTYDGTNLVAGAIQNTPIGATTPATGKFSTLESTGTGSFGTTSAQYIQAVGNALYPQILAVGSGTNIPLVLQPKGTGALQAQLTDSTTAGGNARGANAVDWQTSRGVAGNVASGSFSVIGGGGSNSATTSYASTLSGLSNNAGGVVSIISGGQGNTASGNYTAITGGVSNTSAGWYNFIGGGFTNSGTANAAVTTQSGTMNATTAVTLSGSNANIKVGQYITGTSIAADTYVAAISGTSLTLSKAASGSSTSTLSFFTPHGVVVGGGNNQATGSYSFIGGGGDAGTAANRNVASGVWSAVVGGTRNTASGIASFIGGGGTNGTVTFANTASGGLSVITGGWNNTASADLSTISGGQSNFATAGFSTVAGGTDNLASGSYSSIIGGAYGTARSIVGNAVFPACSFPIATSSGVSQAALLVLGVQTTDATATALRSNSSAAGTTNQVILPNNSAYFFTGEVVSGVTGGGNTKGWTIEGVIKRGANAASTALVGTPTVTSTYADAGASTWTIAVTADTTNGGLRVTFTGQASTTIRTVCQIRTTEMTY